MTVATASSFYVEQVRNITVVCFTVNALDEQNYETISEELLELVSLVTASGPSQVVVELSAIQHIDELGLAMLQAFNDSIEDSGGAVLLCRLHPAVASAMSKAGPTCEFDIRTTRGDAMWSF
ncbi:MAG: STAS domain-containing protein [Candidatus Saccharimonas sp.]|nr:STAS domain-containing protein [Planctomycetaceae bacterium]